MADPGFSPAQAIAPPTHNLLVISDLHIGQDLTGLSRFGALRRVARLDRELRAFLDYYAQNRFGDRPWRLVLAGDVIDFMQVSLRPEDSEVRTRWHRFTLTADEFAYGVGYGPERAVWKLERIVARHRRVFLALAEFVASGHELCVIRGNHDDELHWEEVQTAFLHLLEELHRQAHPGAAAELGRRIRFYPWFYYQEGLLYIEHGHQYDEYSSFEYFLDPVAPREGQPAEMPVPLLALRFFANQFPSFPSLEQDSWTLRDYLRWTLRAGTSPLRVLYMYARLLAKVFLVHRRGRAVTPREPGWLEKRLGALERVYGLPRELLHSIYELHVKPAGHSLWRSIQVFFVDRILVLLAAVAALVTLAVVSLPLYARLPAMLGTCAAAALALWWLARLRDVTCDTQLAVAARELARRLKVKFVVMGHTHAPVARPTEGGSWYLNTGTWIPPRRRPRHAAGCDCRITHLAVLAAESGVRAQLRRWCGALGGPEPIEEVG